MANISDKLLQQIVQFAKKYELSRVVLFGSRARGTNRERSDVDLAVTGKNVSDFQFMLEDEADSLLSFDVVDMGTIVSQKLKQNIEREGVCLYAEV
ncbi:MULTISPECIES: nucleotidyltransferase family protein [unclassified Fibrobacter]|uniref:nucleotidyltransferase family protein n=1 Tax=unclassified Fibrobacter TaxID=2634177 RepID=UPI000D6BB2F5|nr:MULTISPECIES: nucleotidyltransferase domain-containing protein [unclassified Fibrobacter]PWJ71944.1 putative nucleotidyltransferase [Fibrobacter sp. UWR4]PZW70394.1 putative nucleotidyltransferase [Fibrobacter sp. UWR1]